MFYEKINVVCHDSPRSEIGHVYKYMKNFHSHMMVTRNSIVVFEAKRIKDINSIAKMSNESYMS